MKGRTPNSWLYYSCYVDDDFYIFYLQISFQTIHDCYLISKIRLVLSLTLYKFIVQACQAKTQSCFGIQAKTSPYSYVDKFFILGHFFKWIEMDHVHVNIIHVYQTNTTCVLSELLRSCSINSLNKYVVLGLWGFDMIITCLGL